MVILSLTLLNAVVMITLLLLFCMLDKPEIATKSIILGVLAEIVILISGLVYFIFTLVIGG